ncbi:MAG: hypothetical protein AAB339_07175, partial [Elusimicrobiota bacterium]
VADAAPGAVDYVQLLIKDHGTPTLPNDPPGYWDGTTWKFTGVFTTRAVVAGGDWSVVNLPNFEDRHFYTMVSSAVDKAGNPQSQFFFAVNNSSASFYADKAAPTITFNAPPSGDYYTKSMANVTGLVIDPNIVLDPDMTISAGVSGGANVLVQVKYFEGGTTYYWDGSNSFNTPGGGCANCTEPLAWESPLGYAVKGPSSGSWTYSNGGIAVKWLPAKNYTIAARGRDNAYPAQNISSSYTIANVVYDLSWPTATVTGPSNRTPARSVALTSGTVLDNFDGVASVALVISYVQAGATYYWTGSTFTAGAYQTVPAVVAAPGSVNTTWNYTDADLTDWTNNGISYREYVIHAIATDRAGNVHVAGTTSTFVLDNRAPTGTATRPTANALSSSGHNFYGPANLLGNILGNSNDQNSYPAGYPTAEASKVEARIKRDGAGSLVWNACQAGCTWTGADIWQTVNDTSSWNYGLNRLPDFGQGQSLGWDSGRRMSVEVRVTDLVGNLSTLTTQYFTWDSALPTSSLSYPASAYMPAVAAVNGTAADLDTILAGLGKGSRFCFTLPAAGP